MASRGTDYGRVGYGVPVGGNGLRIGASASYLRYRLVTADFAGLGARGNSGTTGLNASYPLLRSRLRNLFLTAGFDDKRFENLADTGTTSRYHIDAWTAGLSGNAFDEALGGGSTAGNLSIEQGRVDLRGSPNRAADAKTLRTAGDFTALRYGISRQQSLGATLSLYASLSGQQARRNLDSSERFYLGGAAGVRAYPTSEAGGSSGQLASLELRGRLPAGFNAAAFVDWGHVTVNPRNDFAGGAAVNGYALKGAGVSAGWIGDRGISVRATLAHRLGTNPNPNANGADQDGTLRKTRLWVTANLSF